MNNMDLSVGLLIRTRLYSTKRAFLAVLRGKRQVQGNLPLGPLSSCLKSFVLKVGRNRSDYRFNRPMCKSALNTAFFRCF